VGSDGVAGLAGKGINSNHEFHEKVIGVLELWSDGESGARI